MHYVIEIKEVLSAEVRLDADSREDALAAAMEGYYTCEIALEKEHLTGVQFNIKEEVK